MGPTSASRRRPETSPPVPRRQPSVRNNEEARDLNGAALPEVVTALALRRTHRRLIQMLALLGDVAAITVAFALGATIMYGDPLNHQALNTIAAILPMYLLLASSQHAFTMAVVARARLGALRAGGSLLIAIFLVGLVAFFLKTVIGVSRGVVGLGTVFAVCSIGLFRVWLAIYSHRLLGDVTINEVVIQDDVPAMALVRKGSIVLDAARDNIALRLDSPSMLDRLGRCLQPADRVVVVCSNGRRALWASALKSSNVNAEILAGELDPVGAIGIGHYNGSTTLAVSTASLSVTDQVFKRALDVALVLLAMPFLVPFMLVCAIAIKLDSHGPVFFRQPRVGLGNRVFRIYKFRSMKVAQTDVMGTSSTSRDDARITRVGRFIRKTSIDEIPQVLNVLAGDMSIVGPRPHPLECKAEERLFWDIDSRYWHRHAVKPGMTGLAQIRGFRGATHKEVDLTNRLQADLEYMAGWSIWRDLGIIVATFRVLVHRNAF